MPHVVIRTPATPAEIGQRFRPNLDVPQIMAAIDKAGATPEQSGGPPQAIIKFLHAYQSLEDGRLLIETYINEDPLRQRLGLEIRQRATGDYVIGLHEVGFPRPTRGVHQAVRWLVRWLQAEFPATIVVNSTLQTDR